MAVIGLTYFAVGYTVLHVGAQITFPSFKDIILDSQLNVRQPLRDKPFVIYE